MILFPEETVWKRWEVSVIKITTELKLPVQRPLQPLDRDQHFTGVKERNSFPLDHACVLRLPPTSSSAFVSINKDHNKP